jgi:hypothetical protein
LLCSTAGIFCEQIGTGWVITFFFKSVCNSERHRCPFFDTRTFERECRVWWDFLLANWIARNRVMIIVVMTYWFLSYYLNIWDICCFMQQSLSSRTWYHFYLGNQNFGYIRAVFHHVDQVEMNISYKFRLSLSYGSSFRNDWLLNFSSFAVWLFCFVPFSLTFNIIIFRGRLVQHGWRNCQ